MVAGVEMPDGAHPGDADRDGGAIRVRLLGPMAVWRDGVEQALPASRKARALFAYLALAQFPLSRSRLCELLWETPSDPRGELRWSLSKIRGLVDRPRRRVIARDDTIRLDLAACSVDALAVSRAVEGGLETIPRGELQALATRLEGDFLEGLELDGSPLFASWLTAQRRRFASCRTALLERLAASASGDQVFEWVEQWLALAPFDRQAHALLLAELAREGRIREAEEHLAAAARLFEAEGLDPAPLRDAWRAARAGAGSSATVAATSAPRGVPGIDGDARGPIEARRASIAVMPFADESGTRGGRGATVADALAHDVITRLAKLRSLFVIAQGTVFSLRDRMVGPDDAGRMLGVDYVVAGSVRRRGERLSVSVELAEARSARIAWAEIFDRRLDDSLLVLEEIGDRIVASVAGEIESMERNRAILKPPDSLDAWEAHHRGLWHMYRFNQADNASARGFFERAVRMDPTFSRAWAGLSFTHFQDAFQGWASRLPEADHAFETAGQALMVDDRDPAAHWAMGRALWLRGRHDEGVAELGRAVELSPNFAQAHYTLAFVHSQDGDPQAAIASADHSRKLSPFDPLMFGMLGARAMALVRLGRFEEAAVWAVKAAGQPNAHRHILAIAAFTLALAGSLDEARAYATAISKAAPAYGSADFLAAFQFDPEGVELFRTGARLLGME
ncbi:transcriptional regulator [Burkholderiaceae bacterium FT117]|uniref:transcriptional regulator n=1 Tax=Zeimonas sediminis TaxID=2944268 RepID=UPI002342DE1F|nr:transcriptional regulator [Zeimonas sediminis]MCM5569863.1 transcriptional regulator [Zeimonas sediminis]